MERPLGENRWGGRPVHPAAELFPLAGEHEIKELADDIREHGLREPIVETVDGRILDGRARYLACDMAGAPVIWHTYKGDDPWGFALTRNFVTRNLDEIRGAFLGARVRHRVNSPIPRDPLKLLPPNRRRIAELLHTTRATISRAKTIVDRGVDGLESCVVDHGVPLYTAARVAELPPEAQREFMRKVRGGMSPGRAAPRRATGSANRRGPAAALRNQRINANRYRYIQREGLTAVRDGLAVLRHVMDTTDGLAPDIDAAEADRWLYDLGRERRNLNQLMNLLKERIQ